MPIFDTIKKYVKGEVAKNVPLKEHTYIKIGGPADIFVIPEEKEGMKWLVKFLKERGIRFFIMGNGTNLIFSDGGFRGVVIKSNRCFDGLKISENNMFVGSGIDLMKAIYTSAESGICGLEKLAGIPGTVGGAVWMNAGAFGCEIKDCVDRVYYIDNEGREKAEKIEMGYRSSSLSEEDIIMGADFHLGYGEREEILADIEEVKRKRKEKQPIDFPSAGSVFKNPDNGHAGEIVERLGMKGMVIGGAEISSKHANFIINRGDGTCDDVKKLIQKVQDEVSKNEGIELELEVEFVPEK
jgi:UDP-N-acetylmuramate dehydrogenase